MGEIEKSIINKPPQLFVFSTIMFSWLLLMCIIFIGNNSLLFIINGFHNKTLDILHVVFSFWGRGDVLTVGMLALIYFVKNKKLFIKWACIYGAVTSIIISGLKYYFDAPRPLMLLPGRLHIVTWMSQAFEYSFPSGHTTGAFSAASFLIVYFGIQNKQVQLVAFLAAAACGISRIYLAQHFPIDVAIGAFLGLVLGGLVGFFGFRNKRDLAFKMKM